MVFIFWVFVGFLFGQEGTLNLIQELANQILGFLNQKYDQHVYVNEKVTESGSGLAGNAFIFQRSRKKEYIGTLPPHMFIYAELVLNDKAEWDKAVKNLIVFEGKFTIE